VSYWLEDFQMCHPSLLSVSWPIRISCERHSTQGWEIPYAREISRRQPICKKRRTDISYLCTWVWHLLHEIFWIFVLNEWSLRKISIQPWLLAEPRTKQYIKKAWSISWDCVFKFLLVWRCPGVQEETQDNTAARFKINVPHRQVQWDPHFLLSFLDSAVLFFYERTSF